MPLRRGSDHRSDIVLRHDSVDGLIQVAWANLLARAASISTAGKLTLAHGTHLELVTVGCIAVRHETLRSSWAPRGLEPAVRNT